MAHVLRASRFMSRSIHHDEGAHRASAPNYWLGRRRAQIVGGVASPTGMIRKRPATDIQPSMPPGALSVQMMRPVDLDSPMIDPCNVAVRTTLLTSVTPPVGSPGIWVFHKVRPVRASIATTCPDMVPVFPPKYSVWSGYSVSGGVQRSHEHRSVR